jgi:hypothetical protein
MQFKRFFAILMVCITAVSFFAPGVAAEVADDSIQTEEKQGSETGIAPIATVVGIAVVAVVGIFFSTKKKK